eukprot:3996824-Pyramimonas_sp.AAC.1
MSRGRGARGNGHFPFREPLAGDLIPDCSFSEQRAAIEHAWRIQLCLPAASTKNAIYLYNYRGEAAECLLFAHLEDSLGRMCFRPLVITASITTFEACMCKAFWERWNTSSMNPESTLSALDAMLGVEPTPEVEDAEEEQDSFLTVPLIWKGAGPMSAPPASGSSLVAGALGTDPQTAQGTDPPQIGAGALLAAAEYVAITLQLPERATPNQKE